MYQVSFISGLLIRWLVTIDCHKVFLQYWPCFAVALSITQQYHLPDKFINFEVYSIKICSVTYTFFNYFFCLHIRTNNFGKFYKNEITFWFSNENEICKILSILYVYNSMTLVEKYLTTHQWSHLKIHPQFPPRVHNKMSKYYEILITLD